MRRRYFDNAATSSPKPPEVWEAMADYARRLGGSPGRGAYHESIEAGRLMHQCRERIRRLINGASAEHVVFALNTSDALNLGIKGLLLPPLVRGEEVHAVTTWMDHNSVLRPLRALEEMFPHQFTVTRVKPDERTTIINPDDLVRAIRSRAHTCLVAINHASNVTGAVQPLEAIARVCQEADVPLLVDAAQSLGHLPIDVRALGIDLLAFPGHKGLLGPTGTGGLYIRPGMEQHLVPLREGGTGTRSELDTQPLMLPDKYEPGSQNAVGIIGLSEGVEYLLRFQHAGERGIHAVRAHERELIQVFLLGLEALSGDLELLGSSHEVERVGVFTIRAEGADHHELAAMLETSFGVLTRAGLHCAPLAHRLLATDEERRDAPSQIIGGGVRFSLGPFLTHEDIAFALDSLAQCVRARRSVQV